MEKQTVRTILVWDTIDNYTGTCAVHYQSESRQTYVWRFHKNDFRLAFRSVTNAVANSGGDLSYSDALVIHEMIRNLAGDDS